MNKLIRPIFALSIVATMVACGGAADKAKDMATEATDAVADKVEAIVEETVSMNLTESKVMWSGNVLGAYSHNGTLNITEGSLEMKGTSVEGGKFTVDMTSMTPTDENYSADKSADMLVGHLSSGDFFLVDSFPTATFVVKSADMEAQTITGDLTVRGVTKEEMIKGVNVKPMDKEATGTLTFNRQDYGVAFAHPAEDVVVSDDIELTISLKM